MYEQGYCNTSTSIQTNTKEPSKGIEGLILMIKSAKNSLSDDSSSSSSRKPFLMKTLIDL